MAPSHFIILLFCLHLGCNPKGYAQDVEPRRWTPLPLKTNVIGIGYVYTEGKIAFDPVIHIEDATVAVNTFAIQYVRPFKLGHKLARVDVLLPYAFAHWKGLLDGLTAEVSRNGFADPRLRLSLNFLGPPAMEAKELQEYLLVHPTHTVVGASLSITFPLGQYYDDKLLNLGQNRFVFRPQIGFVHTWNKWSYELTGSVFFFTDNNEFFNGKKREQDPVFALQTHLVRKFKPTMWASLSLGTGLAGQSIVNNIPHNDDQENILAGVSFAMPIMKMQSLKVVYVRSQTLTNIGADTNSISAVWSTIF
ncbi:transporter [Aequorivita sp. SDUM287046]|uniref:Transporter n=1 Tax=Aequorivita aurantiaca TaxID=3053356 RepID=A0ABT8DHS6_9FLAO|nr:transporter [Aequorivita aurantiaca]MDN3723544.1 transporter [Aequorivita aurantiaca]